MPASRRLWLTTHAHEELERLLGRATADDEALLLEHVEATDTGALEGDLELAAALDRQPTFVADVVRDLARRGPSAPRASEVERVVVDDVLLAVLGAPGPELAARLAHEAEPHGGLLDLSADLRPRCRALGLEGFAATLFDGRRAGGGGAPRVPYFLLAPAEVAPFCADARALLEALPAPKPAPRLSDSSSGLIDLLRIDARGLLDELLVIPLESAAARGRGVFGRWTSSA